MTGKPAVEIVDEAAQLLRRAPASLYWIALAGLLPFALGLLWFVAEMSWSAFASEHLLEYALALAGLFLWKQIWEAVFCAKVHELLSGDAEPWTGSRILRTALTQAALQPWSLVALPLAALTLLPFATTAAYFRNLSLYAGSANASRMARDRAIQWTKQNWILHAFLFLLALLLFANYFAAFLTVTQLAKSILGVESAITRYPMWLFTSTGLSAIGILVYVTLDPLLSAIYVLRCFYGQSVYTGADLRARFRRVAAVAVLFLACCLTPAAMRAQAPAPVTATVDAKQLDQSIRQVVRRREFTWRMPKGEGDGKPRTGVLGWIDSVLARIGDFWEWLKEGLRKLFEPERTTVEKKEAAGVWETALRVSLWVLGAVFAIAAALMLYRQAKDRKTVTITAAAAAPAEVDLRDEGLTADKLPENSWLALAQEWIDKGDLRLALRAMHLAGLSYLNGRNLVTIQRWKTGMEYGSEVSRRAKSTPAIGEAFHRNTRVFEMAWYGRHETTPEMLDAFSKGLNEVKANAERV